MSQAQGKQTNYLGIGAAVVILAIVLVAVISQASKPAAVENVAVDTVTDADTNTDTENTTDTAATTDTTTPSTTPPVTTTTADPAPIADTSTYEDGTYTMVGSYNSPAGPETLGVTVTLKDDVITAVSVEPQATAPASVNWQNTFASNYKPLVIGKKIDDVKLTKVSGSSLTPKGFNDAITKIKAQAEA